MNSIAWKEERKRRLKYTLVLTRSLPRRTAMHKRFYIDGRKLDTEMMLQLLKAAGHKIEIKDEESNIMATEYNKIKLKSFNSGMMVAPNNSEDFVKLKKILTENGYFSHVCG